MASRPEFVIVVPCLNEEEALPSFLEAGVPILEKLCDGNWGLLFVDDGSTDRTAEILAQAHAGDSRIKAISLSRNFGHQPAIATGLAYADGDYIGIMDSDLQDPFEVLEKLYFKVAKEDYDVCLGARGKRDAPLLLRICYPLFYRLIRAASDHEWPVDAGDFCVMNRKVQQALLALPERDRMLRGLRSWVGFRQTSVEYDRPRRELGETKYSYWRLASLALSAFVGFSRFPLRLASVLGFLMSLFSLGMGVLFLLNRIFPSFTLFGYYVGTNPGTTTLVVYVSLITGMLFFCLGIIGEYVALLVRETKKRPVAVVTRTYGVDDPPECAHVVGTPSTDE